MPVCCHPKIPNLAYALFAGTKSSLIWAPFTDDRLCALSVSGRCSEFLEARLGNRSSFEEIFGSSQLIASLVLTGVASLVPKSFSPRMKKLLQ